jgi:hypothetical protein
MGRGISHKICASVCIDQILTEFGEYPCPTKHARILAPTPHVEANSTDAQHDAQRQEQRTQRSESRSESRDLNVVAALSHEQITRNRSLKSLHYFCNYKAISGVADD